MYQAIYKCRMCNEVEIDMIPFDKQYAISEVTKVVTKKDGNFVFMNRPHNCNDESIGVMDFQGFKKVGD